MEGLGHILDRLIAGFDLDELHSSRRTTLDGDRGLAAAEVASDQRDELLVRLAIYGRRFELSEPYTTFFWREKAEASARLDLHLNGRYALAQMLTRAAREQRAQTT